MEVQAPLTRSAILALLERSDKANLVALERIAARQTSEELSNKVTALTNNRGFTSADAAFLTDMHERLRKGRGFSPKQLAVIRKCMPKYWRQLLEEAQIKGHEVIMNPKK